LQTVPQRDDVQAAEAVEFRTDHGGKGFHAEFVLADTREGHGRSVEATCHPAYFVAILAARLPLEMRARKPVALRPVHDVVVRCARELIETTPEVAAADWGPFGNDWSARRDETAAILEGKHLVTLVNRPVESA